MLRPISPDKNRGFWFIDWERKIGYFLNYGLAKSKDIDIIENMRERIVAGNIYHVVSRGVDKRQIYMEDKNYFRFIHDLFEFNDTEPASNLDYLFKRKFQSMDFASPNIEKEGKKPRKLLVEILAFALLPNHYHLLLRPLSNDGLVKFMRKLNIGYAKYFNEKFNRTGALFEGRYRLVPVIDESHFTYLPYYIHLNPLDLIFPEWRTDQVVNAKKAMEFLETYRWSSHLDYLGKNNFPSITQREFLTGILGEPAKYRENMGDWLKDVNLSDASEILME